MTGRTVQGKAASDLFLKQVESKRVEEYLHFLNLSVPYEVFVFDVQVDLSVQTNAEQIAKVMYRVLLRNLDYAGYDISELEIELESEDRLSGFQDLRRQDYKDEWRKIRKGYQKFARTGALLHRLDPNTYASTETWLEIVKHRPSRHLSVGDFAGSSFGLCALRRPGKAFAFIVDEMGQYVARAVVEQSGTLNRLTMSVT